LSGLILLMRYKIGEPARPQESVQEPKCARNGCDNKAYPKSESSPCWDCKSCCLNPRHWNLCDHHFQEEHGHDEDEDEDEPNEYMDEHMDCVVCKRTDIPRKDLHWDSEGSYTDTCEECYKK